MSLRRLTRRGLLLALNPLLAGTLLSALGGTRLLFAGDGQREAPDFDRPDLSGRQFHLRALRGQVVLLNFWATWCAPCLSEMPVFSQWQRELGSQGLQILGIAMDDEPGPVVRTVHRLAPAYPIVMGDAALARAYGGVLGLPVTLLVGRDGTIRRRYESAEALNAIRKDVLQQLG